VFSRRNVPVHPEDEKILSTFREVCAQLNYYKFNIQAISWKGRIGARRFPPDALIIIPRFHVLQLSNQAMGRLSPEEWRPILVSGLLYYKNFNRGMLKAILPTMATALLSPFIILADVKLLGSSQFGVLYDLVLVALIIIVMLSIIPFLLLHKKLYLEMDDKAVQIVGKESLIASLTKLASIDQSMTTGKTGFFRPSIQERIQHLATLAQ
jgi:hypothetical protein